MKKIVTCIISFILLMMCIPLTVVAEENEKTIVYRTSGHTGVSGCNECYWTLIAYDDSSFYVDVIGGSDTSGSIGTVGKIIYDDNIVSCCNTVLCSTFVFTTYTDTCAELNVVSRAARTSYFGSSFAKLYFTVKELDSENSCTIKVFDTDVTIDFSKSSIKPSYAEITYNNGSAAIRIKTDTDVSDIQKYIDELEAKNALLRQENAELKNRINLISDGSCGDIDGDGNISVEDAQLLLQYYTESKVAQLTNDPIDVWYFTKFGKG